MYTKLEILILYTCTCKPAYNKSCGTIDYECDICWYIFQKKIVSTSMVTMVCTAVPAHPAATTQLTLATSSPCSYHTAHTGYQLTQATSSPRLPAHPAAITQLTLATQFTLASCSYHTAHPGYQLTLQLPHSSHWVHSSPWPAAVTSMIVDTPQPL